MGGTSMWTVDGQAVRLFGLTPGGDRFTKLVDETIRAHAAVCKLLQSAIHTNLRTNLPDGGVDTRVDEAIPIDTFGWMDVPTIFQYKATDRKSAMDAVKADLKKIGNTYLKQCVQSGHGYRLCICDEITPEEKKEFEQELLPLLQAINPQSPLPKILSAGDIAAWFSQFPALVAQYFRLDLASSALHLSAWKDSITAVTQVFVPVPAWQATRDNLARHLDWTEVVTDIVLPIQGDAGVGKTRLAYEVVAAIAGSAGFVLYLSDEQNALNVARIIANDRALKAVIIADECSVKTRQELTTILRGQRERVRVVTIDNSGERPMTGAPENVLRQMAPAIVEQVLGRNFSHVPPERRRAYADLSGGFVRLAADMCQHDSMIVSAGNVGPISQNVRDYVVNRLPNGDDLRTLEALALLDKVGFKEDVEEELGLLCAISGLTVTAVKETARKLHDAPGFVQQAGRYFSVTPEIVAQAAFEGAWRRWGETDPNRFLKDIPAPILESFLRRVSRSAHEEVRAQTGEFFRRSAASLRPDDLASLPAVDRLVILVETHPDVFLATLRRLIEEATEDELKRVHGESRDGKWGPRRQLVWLLERIAAFPVFFDDAQASLQRLALAESEPGIGNNATAMWCQLFRIVLSGTALPFEERLRVLTGSLQATSVPVVELALASLEGILNFHGTRMLGPAVVGGRIPPPEWRPKTNAEHRSCLEITLRLMSQLAEDYNEPLRSRLLKIALQSFRPLLQSGLLGPLRALLRPEFLSDELRLELLKEAQETLEFDFQDHASSTPEKNAYAAGIMEWVTSLKPQDFHGRLVTAVGQDPWLREKQQNEQGISEIRILATGLLADPELFNQEVTWLASPNARSAGNIGLEMGRLDPSGAFLDRIIAAAVQEQSAMLARGYISGLLEAGSDNLARINMVIDKVAQGNPDLAFHLAATGGRRTGFLTRGLDFIDEGRLPISYIQAFVGGIGGDLLTIKEFQAVMERLLARTPQGDTNAASVAIEFVGARLRDEEAMQPKVILTDEEGRASIWTLLRLTLTIQSGRMAFWWSYILQALTPSDPPQSVELAVAASLSDNVSLSHEISFWLVRMAAEYPQEVMVRLGMAIMDSNLRWRFYIGQFKEVVRALPTTTVIEWLKAHDSEPAAYLARHTPAPYLGAEDEPVVPELTAFLLTHFENDERVFHEFVAGVNNMKFYEGDIAAEHDREARLARQFLNHPLRRVREWADLQVVSAEQEARQWREQEEEWQLG